MIKPFKIQELYYVNMSCFPTRWPCIVYRMNYDDFGCPARQDAADNSTSYFK